jgi:hypothetical protein
MEGERGRNFVQRMSKYSSDYIRDSCLIAECERVGFILKVVLVIDFFFHWDFQSPFEFLKCVDFVYWRHIDEILQNRTSQKATARTEY